jgi:hypothetical protein
MGRGSTELDRQEGTKADDVRGDLGIGTGCGNVFGAG